MIRHSENQSMCDEVGVKFEDDSEQIRSGKLINPSSMANGKKIRVKIRSAEDRQHRSRDDRRLNTSLPPSSSRVLSLKPPPPMKLKVKKKSKPLKVTHTSQSENILRYFTPYKGVLHKVRDGDGPMNHSNIHISGDTFKRETTQLSQPPTGPGQDESEECDLLGCFV